MYGYLIDRVFADRFNIGRFDIRQDPGSNPSMLRALEQPSDKPRHRVLHARSDLVAHLIFPSSTMRFVNITTAFAISTLTQAFVIPSGTTDGVYAVSTRDDGTDVHIKISDAPETKRGATDITSIAEVSALERRQSDRIWCGCGYNMDPGNCDAAVADLKNQLKPAFVNAGMAYYSIRGNVVAFACNRERNAELAYLIFAGNYTTALERITGSCGRYIAGSTELHDDKRKIVVGYQRYKNGDDFCTSSTYSSVSRC